MRAAVHANGGALQYASPELQDDPGIVKVAVASEWWALEFASEKLRDCQSTVLAAVRHCGGALRYASTRLRDNHDVVVAAVKTSGTALRYASVPRRADRHVVRAALDTHSSVDSSPLTFHPAVRWVLETDLPLLCARLRLALATATTADSPADVIELIGTLVNRTVVIDQQLVRRGYWQLYMNYGDKTPMCKKRRIMEKCSW